MPKRVLIVLFVAMLVPDPSTLFAQSELLPKQISQYYTDVNFVNSYGRPAELALLANHLWAANLPQSLDSSPRMHQIRSSMQRMARQVRQIDPGMPLVPRWGPYVEDLPEVFGGNLLDVISNERRGDRVVIKVRRHLLRPSALEKLVSAYEKPNARQDLPSEEEVLRSASPQNFTGAAEFHTWQKSNSGRWIKSETNIVLLNQRL